MTLDEIWVCLGRPCGEWETKDTGERRGDQLLRFPEEASTRDKGNVKGLDLEIKTPATILLEENKYRMEKEADRWRRAEGVSLLYSLSSCR